MLQRTQQRLEGLERLGRTELVHRVRQLEGEVEKHRKEVGWLKTERTLNLLEIGNAGRARAAMEKRLKGVLKAVGKNEAEVQKWWQRNVKQVLPPL